MANKAYQRTYTQLSAITKATISLGASHVTNEELAVVDGKLAQVVKTRGNDVTLQVFSGTEGIPTNAEVSFLGTPPTLKVSEQLAGRFFNAYGHPIDGGPEVEGEERETGGPSVNPYKRRQPSELIPTGIAGIDLNNTLVTGQKIPFFADPDQPYNRVMADVALRADVDKNEKVLVLLTDMTLYADALCIVSNRMDQIPSKDSMPGSLYSDLAKIYEKAVQLPTGGSITIIAVTTLNDGDITHAIPDNTGYITEGQLFLRADSDSGCTIVDPFRSLSRLKQLVQGKKTREDHSQVMNAGVRLYADAQNAKSKLENGFDLSDYDLRCIDYAKEYATRLLSIEVNIRIEEMLDIAWELFAKYFTPAETGIKQALMDKYGKWQ